jgi:hypothetical protein
MNRLNPTATTSDFYNQISDSIDEIKNDLREIQKISKQRTDRFLKAVDNLQGIMATDTILRKTKKKAGRCKEYCSHNTEIEAKPKSADEIKSKILNDLKSGIEILKENITPCNLHYFYKPFQLLNSKYLDTSKLYITNQTDDGLCKYIDGTNTTSYTVVYDNTELFTITNTDSETRFANAEESTSGLNFDLEILPGFDKIYTNIDLTTVNSLLSAKDRIEADIKSGIAIYEDQNKNKNNATYGYSQERCNEKINKLEKILEILKSDSIDSTKIEIKDLFGDYLSSKKGYTVFYNGAKLFTINNIDQGKFLDKYIRIKDFELEFHDGYNELYNSIPSVVYADAIGTRDSILNELNQGLEDAKNQEEINNINKILTLLNSNTIDIRQLKQKDFTGSFNIYDDEDNDYNDWTQESGFTVEYNGEPIFSTNKTTGESIDTSFEVELFDYFHVLSSQLLPFNDRQKSILI